MTLAALLAAEGVRAAVEWRDAPEFVRVFAPAAHQTAYRAAVSEQTLETVLMTLAHDESLVRTPGAWIARPQFVLDAFGHSGSYDRSKLVRLYGSRQPRVVRGARMDAGRVVESWTLVSPYPSADLTRLEPGTLRIVLRTP